MPCWSAPWREYLFRANAGLVTCLDRGGGWPASVATVLRVISLGAGCELGASEANVSIAVGAPVGCGARSALDVERLPLVGPCVCSYTLRVAT